MKRTKNFGISQLQEDLSYRAPIHPPSLPEKISPEVLESAFVQGLKYEELQLLCLPQHLAPPVGRGLPKKYSQTNPAVCEVKESFSNVALLRQLRIEKAVFFLYQQQKLPVFLKKRKKNYEKISNLKQSKSKAQVHRREKIAIFTWIIADGMGDYFAQQETANVLLDKFPDLYLISILHKDCPIPLLHARCPHYLIRYAGKLNHPIIHEAFSDQLFIELSQTNLLLELPTAFPYMTQLLQILKKSNPTLKHQRIGEHSLIESLDFRPITGARCMGLHPLEMGIFSKKDCLTKNSIFNLQYQPLLHLLFKSKTQEELECYLQTHTFNVAYTKTFRGTYLYLHMLCKGVIESKKDIDLCFFNLDLMLSVISKRIQKEGKFPLWEECKIGKVLIYTHHHVVPIIISNELKTLRMIHCPTLIQQDLHTLFCFTEHLIGCTGDQTLCEAISLGMPFFYDPPPFKRAVLKDLLFLAKSRLQKYPSLEKLFKLLLKNPHILHEEADGEWVSEDYVQSEIDRLSLDEDCDEKIGDALALLLCDPKIKEGFSHLSNIIHHEYSFEPILEGIINRILFHQYFPELMQWEQAALFQFAKENLSAANFLTLLKEKLYHFQKR